MSTVRISEKLKERVEEVADQLGTGIKETIDMILTWFFDTDWGNPDVIARLSLEDVDEEEDENEDEANDALGIFLDVDEDEDE